MTNKASHRERIVSISETIDLNRLRILVKVIELGSFTAAARALALPKSSVSKAVSHLETALGVRLLQRTSRTIQVTDAGTSLYEDVRPALSVMAEATSTVALLGGEPRGRVRVSCPPDFDELLAGYIAKFRRRYPRITVDLTLTVRNVDLVADGYDLVLRGGKLSDSRLIARCVLRSEFGLFASPAYVRRRGAPRDSNQLASHDIIGVGPTGARADRGRVRWTLKSEEQTHDLRLPCAVTTDDMRFAARLAAAGGGIVLLPLGVAIPFVRQHALVRVLPKLAVPDMALQVVTPNRGLEPIAVRLFREGLINERWSESYRKDAIPRTAAKPTARATSRRDARSRARRPP